MKRVGHTLKWVMMCLLIIDIGACSIINAPPPGVYGRQDVEYENLMEKGRHLANDRFHKKAMEIFDQAGILFPERPEWEYEKAQAYFHMGQYPESIAACQDVLDRAPDFYDALSFSWIVRLKSDNSSPAMKGTVRREIRALLDAKSDDTDALMAVYEGYQWLKDHAPARKLIVEMAQNAGYEDPETREVIAQRLFEQIISASNENDAGTADLLNAYAMSFPIQRHTAYAVSQLLKTLQKEFGEDAYWEQIAASLINNSPDSYPVKTGVAYWLIENNLDSEQAVSLLKESLVLADNHPVPKPRFFKSDAWKKEREKQKDKVRLFLGRVLYNAGSYDAAFHVFETLAESGYLWGDIYYYLGKIAQARGRKKQALDFFRRALEIGVRDDDTNTLLSRLLVEAFGYEGDPAAYFAERSGEVDFADVTQVSGLGGVKARRVAWGDFDGDGYDDLLLDGNRLFKNTGAGSFVDITDVSGLEDLKKTNGGIWGDYNNDALPDIFVTARSGNHLFENSGNGLFIDRTSILPEPERKMDTEAAAWGDMDNDGFLDLYLANYEDWGVMRAIGTPDRLYRNKGGTHFENVTDQVGIISDEAMCGRGVTWTDINLDGFQDIVVANYRLDPNFLWVNQKGGFRDKARAFGVRGTMVDGAFGHSVGPVSGDMDNDTDTDLFISNLAHPRYIEFSDGNMMLINEGGPDYHFTDGYASSGIFFEETNADPALSDIDNDGDLDLYISSIYSGRYSHLYVNEGEGKFKDISWTSATRVGNSWGAAFCDYDHDGFTDLLVASADGIRLLKNNGNKNHWVAVSIVDEQCNRFGIGSRVTVQYGGSRQVREVFAGRGTGSQDSLTLIFGLGNYLGPVEISAKTLCGDILKTVIDHPDRKIILKN